MEIISQNVSKLRSTLRNTIFIDDYLKTHVIPKVPQKNINLNKLDPYNVQVSIVCPFHEERQASYRLYKKHSQDHFDDWYCFGSCRTGGGIVELHQHTMKTFYNRKLTYLQSLESLAELYNIKHDDLFFDPKATIKTIQKQSITQDQILEYLTNEKYRQPIQQEDHYGKYCNLIESVLYKLKQYSLEDYINGVVEIDYLFSLGLQNIELCIELESLLRRLENSLTRYTTV